MLRFLKTFFTSSITYFGIAMLSFVTVWVLIINFFATFALILKALI